MGLGGDWKRGPCEGVVIAPIGGGSIGRWENVSRVCQSGNAHVA
jgi:hypothetical protein